LSRLLDDLGSGSLAELSKTMRSQQLTPTTAVLDFGGSGRFRLTVQPETTDTHEHPRPRLGRSARR
jgi:hypothetical protein